MSLKKYILFFIALAMVHGSVLAHGDESSIDRIDQAFKSQDEIDRMCIEHAGKMDRQSERDIAGLYQLELDALNLKAWQEIRSAIDQMKAREHPSQMILMHEITMIIARRDAAQVRLEQARKVLSHAEAYLQRMTLQIIRSIRG